MFYDVLCFLPLFRMDFLCYIAMIFDHSVSPPPVSRILFCWSKEFLVMKNALDCVRGHETNDAVGLFCCIDLVDADLYPPSYVIGRNL